MITLIGMGSGTPESLTAQGLAALQNAGLILGAKRLLEQLPQGCTDHRKARISLRMSLPRWRRPEVDAALVYSGDTGFYSGAAQLLPMLRAFGISCRVLPGLSSVQLLAAAVGRSWQEWKLVSAHGCACDPVAECLTAGGKPVFFLTGGQKRLPPSAADWLLPGWAMPMCWWAKSWAGQRKRSCSARRRNLRKSSLQA